MNDAQIIHGDCIEIMRTMPDNSVDAVITDPPYGLSALTGAQIADVMVKWATGQRDYMPTGKGFMGKSWDAFVPPPALWDEAHRVLKPGGHLLAFAGTRTQDLMGLSIRLAGFEIRENLAWMHGQGFPKSMDVAKAIDRELGAERVPEAAKWAGYGTALKPAFEPVIVARKPLTGTVAQNVLQHRTGALNIDACRIGTEIMVNPSGFIPNGSNNIIGGGPRDRSAPPTIATGRWPANVALDENMAQVLDGQSGVTTSKKADRGADGGIFRLHGFSNLDELAAAAERGDKCPDGRDARETYRRAVNSMSNDNTRGHNDSGGASRFFYVNREDEESLNDGAPFMYVAKAPKKERPVVDGVAHPTVKPLALMRWLVRLVTPEGGVVLDPFAGSGTTVEAAILEGFQVIGIEREAEYLPLIQARIERNAA